MKKLCSLVLALALSLSLAVPALAADPYEEQDAAWNLYYLGLFQGTDTDEEGFPVFSLDRAPTRAQGVTMLVRLIGQEAAALDGEWTTPFTDVPEWAAPYVGYAYENGLTNGKSETLFVPNATVSATEYLTFVLRALGYDSSADFAWDSAWTLSDELEITDGSYNAETNLDFDRGDAALISNNALSAAPKGSDVTLEETLKELGALNLDNQRCMMDWDVATCYPDSMFFSFCAGEETPEVYTQFVVNSVSANGVPCTVNAWGTQEELLAFYEAHNEAPEGAKVEVPEGMIAMLELSYDEEAAKAAATDTHTESGIEYPVIAFKFNCTGILPDGTEVEELFVFNIYIDGYGGPY